MKKKKGIKKIKKKVWKFCSPFIFFVEKYLAALLLLILGLTYKIKTKGSIPEGKVIFSFWHRNIIPLIYFHKFRKIAVLISPSKDGEYISGPVSVLGYKPVRGSANKKSKAALKELISISRKHDLAITPDGPKGPIYELKDGVLFLSYITKNPIVPLKINISNEWVFGSWDRFRFPKPFSKIDIEYGEPVYIDIPMINYGAIHIVKKYDAKYVFECARMYKGNPPKVNINRVYGITTFELG